MNTPEKKKPYARILKRPDGSRYSKIDTNRGAFRVAVTDGNRPRRLALLQSDDPEGVERIELDKQNPGKAHGRKGE